MKLHTGDATSFNDRGKRVAVGGRGDCVFGDRRGIAVRKVDLGAVVHAGKDP